MTAFGFLPIELRLRIYWHFLLLHRLVNPSEQASSLHFRLLGVSREIRQEAEAILWLYVSLRTERQIVAFISNVTEEQATRIEYADVANDDRIGKRLGLASVTPLSQLYRALQKMSALKHLRVFEPEGHYSAPNIDLGYMILISAEMAMFPPGSRVPHLQSYELFWSTGRHYPLFDRVPSCSIQTLRLSGSCRSGSTDLSSMTCLSQLIIHGLTGDQISLEHPQMTFCESRLDSFSLQSVGKRSFEITDAPLLRLINSPVGGALRKLVLLQSKRLSTEGLSACFEQLLSLEYLALSFSTIELRSNFIAALPGCLKVLKLAISYNPSTSERPSVEQEWVMFEALDALINRLPSPSLIYLDICEMKCGYESCSSWPEIARQGHWILRQDYHWEREERL